MTDSFARFLDAKTTGQAYPAVRPSDVGSFEFLLPPIEEQRAIADILDSIDEAIERTEGVIAATERLRDALLHDLLTRGLPGRHTH
jgi:type I restriction enzyme S subunit